VDGDRAYILLGRADQYGRLDRIGIERVRFLNAIRTRLDDAPHLVLAGGCKSEACAISEAQQMHDLLEGEWASITHETWSSTTAENALFVAQLLEQMPDVREVDVVTSFEHALRARVMFAVALRGSGVRLRVLRAPHGGWRGVIHELRYLPHIRRNLRDARDASIASAPRWRERSEQPLR
jgi:hypothetical protein